MKVCVWQLCLEFHVLVFTFVSRVGTVEFIFDAATDEYFFMEMNTRLQVEHPVTEMVMRRDLVQLQLHVASGHPLPCTQKELAAHGHAVEARIYAESPQKNFLPMTGRLDHLRTPEITPYCRVESGVREGDEVSIYYDPMIAKLIVSGNDRLAALQAMSTALESYEVVGPPTNIEFLKRAVAHPAFVKGTVHNYSTPTLTPRYLRTPTHHVRSCSTSRK